MYGGAHDYDAAYWLSYGKAFGSSGYVSELLVPGCPIVFDSITCDGDLRDVQGAEGGCSYMPNTMLEVL